MSRDQHPTPVAAKLVAALDRLARAQRHQRQAAASRLGITPLQGELLRLLGDGPPPEPLVGLLARELAVSQPTVTDSLAALERKGLVVRERTAEDQRRSRFELSDTGRELTAALARADGELIAAVSGLAEDRQETTYVALLELIKRFVATGLIDVDRSCLTCKYLSEVPGSGRHCLLLDMTLPNGALLVNCPDHEPAEVAAV